jgi:hypothetical protein
VVACTMLAALGTNSGCVGVAAQLLYVIKGDKVEAEFEGLEGKKVAVVCLSNTSGFDPGSASSTLAQYVELNLRKNVKKIQMIRQQEIANWVDNNDWDRLDYRDIGRGVRADMVVAIDLDNFRLHEDATLFKGRTNWTVTVYDMSKSGEAVFRRSERNFQFPVNGGQHVSETTEDNFQRKFLLILAEDVAKHFYAYEFKEDFARDALIAH